MKVRKLAWHTPVQDCPPTEAGRPIVFKHEEQKRIVGGSSYQKVLEEKKIIAVIFLLSEITHKTDETNVFILCPRNLNSMNVPQKHTRKRTKCMCKVFLTVLFVAAEDWKPYFS